MKNEPVFPQNVYSSKYEQTPPGMLLLDYFAAKAMQSICLDIRFKDDINLVATYAYQQAAAMLKERDRITLEPKDA